MPYTSAAASQPPPCDPRKYPFGKGDARPYFSPSSCFSTCCSVAGLCATAFPRWLVYKTCPVVSQPPPRCVILSEIGPRMRSPAPYLGRALDALLSRIVLARDNLVHHALVFPAADGGVYLIAPPDGPTVLILDIGHSGRRVDGDGMCIFVGLERNCSLRYVKRVFRETALGSAKRTISVGSSSGRPLAVLGVLILYPRS